MRNKSIKERSYLILLKSSIWIHLFHPYTLSSLVFPSLLHPTLHCTTLYCTAFNLLSCPNPPYPVLPYPTLTTLTYRILNARSGQGKHDLDHRRVCWTHWQCWRALRVILGYALSVCYTDDTENCFPSLFLCVVQQPAYLIFSLFFSVIWCDVMLFNMSWWIKC